MAAESIYDIPVKRIDGQDASLGEYKGKVVLVVNVASKCGLTPQYAKLEALYDAYGDKGLVVTGFPANEFGAQEPGSNEDIAEFCETQFHIKFPMFAKIVVKGEGIHPLYANLTKAVPTAVGASPNAPKTSDIMWNFEKFLIGRDGSVAGRFAPTVAPDDSKLVAAIEAELAK
jgi:glutathione peroxidase